VHLRGRAQNLLQSGNSAVVKAIEDLNGEEKSSKSSVAYVVIIPRLPQLHHQSGQTENSAHDGEEKEEKDSLLPERSDHLFHKRAKVLSKSIERAHMNSPYGYQMHALNLMDASTTDGGDSGDSKQVHDALIQSGFKIINVDKDKLSEIIGNELKVDSERKVKGIDEQKHNLFKLLNEHDIVVQISLNSFLLKPMDDIFDVLVNDGVNVDKVMGVVDDKKGEGKSEQEKNDAGKAVDSFVLESSDEDASPSVFSAVESELVVFRSKSQQARNSFAKSLECKLSYQVKVGAIQDGSNSLKIRPPSMVARKTRENTEPGLLQKEGCKIQAENSLLLDRCLYNAGDFSFGRDCSQANVKADAPVAHFPEGNAMVSKVEGGGVPKGAARGPSQCAKPWECLKEEDCTKNTGEQQGQDALCAWLISEWFNVDAKK
jgi:hypothetical protein